MTSRTMARSPLLTSGERAVVLAVVAAGVAALHLPWRPPTLCLLRATTGIPCPVCGGTTAMVDLGEARPAAAVLASPLVVLGALVLLVRPLLPPRPLVTSRRALWALILAAGVLSELWQLHRFALL